MWILVLVAFAALPFCWSCALRTCFCLPGFAPQKPAPVVVMMESDRISGVFSLEKSHFTILIWAFGGSLQRNTMIVKLWWYELFFSCFCWSAVLMLVLSLLISMMSTVNCWWLKKVYENHHMLKVQKQKKHGPVTNSQERYCKIMVWPTLVDGFWHWASFSPANPSKKCWVIWWTGLNPNEQWHGEYPMITPQWWPMNSVENATSNRCRFRRQLRGGTLRRFGANQSEVNICSSLSGTRKTHGCPAHGWVEVAEGWLVPCKLTKFRHPRNWCFFQWFVGNLIIHFSVVPFKQLGESSLHMQSQIWWAADFEKPHIIRSRCYGEWNIAPARSVTTSSEIGWRSWWTWRKRRYRKIKEGVHIRSSRHLFSQGFKINLCSLLFSVYRFNMI